LANLGGAYDPGNPTPNRARLIDEQLASSEKGEYRFAMGGCDRPPVSRFQVTAIPLEPNSGLRVFCEDESAIVRYSRGGDGEKCFSEGIPLQ
jgi:hypothetical protein